MKVTAANIDDCKAWGYRALDCEWYNRKQSIILGTYLTEAGSVGQCIKGDFCHVVFQLNGQIMDEYGTHYSTIDDAVDAVLAKYPEYKRRSGPRKGLKGVAVGVTFQGHKLGRHEGHV